MDKYAEEKRTEHNLIVRSGKSEVEVIIITDGVRGIVLLIADRDKASRGLSVTAELLVILSCTHCAALCKEMHRSLGLICTPSFRLKSMKTDRDCRVNQLGE